MGRGGGKEEEKPCGYRGGRVNKDKKPSSAEELVNPILLLALACEKRESGS